MPPKPVELFQIGDSQESARRCSLCKEIKALATDFHRNARGPYGYHTICKVCNVKKASDYQKNNRDRRRGNLLSARYGISSEEYAEMYIKQEGKCLICKEVNERLVVDHCHATDIVRGLLCDRCNRGIGAFGDNPRLIMDALKYLLQFENPYGEEKL